jgi:exopolysaccharide biosynthesis polyprenyl glycosylphosphotransferase
MAVEQRTVDVPAVRRPAQSQRELRPPSHWVDKYVRLVVLADVAAIIAATLLAYLIRFSAVDVAHPTQRLAVLGCLPVVWLGSLLAFRAYETRFMGLGSEEFDRVLRSATFVLAVVATLSWAFKLEIARGFVILALPLATLLTLAGRYALRRWLHAQRSRGLYTQRVLVAGHRAGVIAMVRQMNRASYHGMRVAGVCLPEARPDGGFPDAELDSIGVPQLGSLEDIAEVAAREGVDAVAVLPTPELDGPALRRLGWALEGTHAELFVAPAVTEVIGPRVAIRPVCGLPLLHLERPELTGVRRVAKGSVDRLGAAVGLLLLLPVLVAIAVAIKLDSRGPVFFRQARIGKDGVEFPMLKFRSMVTNAEQLLNDLREHSEGNGVLFKMRQDPRVTRVGRFLRRLSLDELPQLVNVLTGQMSLVGPRPPLAVEVATYGDAARRKLLVKPGLTGLWQINGRSDLDWDESVRLDLRYVENWSFAFDLMILWKTLGAVLRSRGAY